MNPEISSLNPINGTYLVTTSGVEHISPANVSSSIIGEKAFGLSCLPRHWTLPYFVISNNFFLNLISEHSSEKNITTYLHYIEQALKKIGLKKGDSIFIRSSAVNETMKNHGKYLTIPGNVDSLSNDLHKYFNKCAEDEETKNERIHLIIQLSAVSAHHGHLSNERRFYKEQRDWRGQFESKRTLDSFNINLRNWRQQVILEEIIAKPLFCNLEVNIQAILRFVASWGSSHPFRIHFEWVWNGERIYIVQAEKEVDSGNFNPRSIIEKPKGLASIFKLDVLKKIERKHGERYSKIHNAYVYLDLNLSSVPLFILDDQEMIKNVAAGNVSNMLKADLKKLTSRSLVIRTDLETNSLLERQMLPRTNEVRTFKSAVEWLIKSCSETLKEHPKKNIAFIFHNFIPAEASAFVFAAPGQRKVEIESLWGIPEGLYYNPHDKYIVDTLHSQINVIEQNIKNFKVKRNTNHKPYCVASDKDGKWNFQSIEVPFDWNNSIRKEEWIKKIAYQSRLIAEKENKSISIMWFIGVPTWASSGSVLPWFHEYYDKDKIPRYKNRRKKTPFDKHFTIRSKKDINQLEKLVSNGDKSIRQILVQPQQEALLRDKHTLKKIAELAKKIDSVILLEGATLSHAYYQLCQVGAIVHVTTPFDIDEDNQEFNKLVRDGVPKKIVSGGEKARTLTLVGDGLIKAIKEKLVEEALEVLDANDHDSIIEEIADVLEVIDALTTHIGADKEEILHRKQKKHDKVGGFTDGLILLDTSNPAPSSSPELDRNLKLDLGEEDSLSYSNRKATSPPKPQLKKWSDKRKHLAANETILNIEFPILIDQWSADSQEINPEGSNNISVRANIQGKRNGAKIKLELSVYSSSYQYDLLNK